ncbi:MAG: hypothetical protein HY924_12995 [Elusimicrobia bacterium]|nr:hypothetical protein [Elusimicrobiota bacterium]
MNRFLSIFLVSALLLPAAALAASSLDPAKDLPKEELSFCVAKVRGGGLWNECVATRRYLIAVRQYEAGLTGGLPPMADLVSIAYCRDLGEKTKIISIRLGTFFAPLL